MKKTAEPIPKLQVRILSPFEVYFEGTANSVSAHSKTGPFDVLANHANFMALLTPGVVRLQTDIGRREFKISRGIIKVASNQVILFANV